MPELFENPLMDLWPHRTAAIWGPHQWSVEMWRLHVHGAKSYSRFRVNQKFLQFLGEVRFWARVLL